MHHHRLALAKKLLLRSSFFSAKQTSSSSPFPCRFRFISSEPPPFSHQTPNDPNTNTNTNSYTTDSSSSSSTPPPPPPPRDRDRDRARPTPTTYEEEQARVLAASLHHVIRLGWSEAAMIAGARDVSVSPSIVGSIPRKEAALVEYFMDHCFQKLVDTIDSDSDSDSHFKDLVPSDRIAYLIKLRLLMQAPYISKWPQALSIQAQPSNISTSFKQRAMLVDDFCHASNDEEATGVDWYLKRSVVGGIYSSTEIYMLTDNSTDFDDTWAFLNERVRDAFDLKKTFQEVKYFAEAVGAGLGSSLQGFTKKG